MIGIIQLARIGDILQSLPVIKHFEKKGKVLLICNEIFSDFVKKMKIAKEILPVPYNLKNFAEDFKKISTEIKKFHREVEKIYSLNYLPESFILGKILSCDFEIYDYNFVISQAIYRRYARINLADVYRYSFGIKGRFEVCSDSVQSSICGIVCDAGHRKRDLPPAFVKNLIKILVREGFKVYLFGRKSQIYNFKDDNNLKNFVGKTKLEEVVEIMKECEWIISPDTGLMHLASYLGKKLICIFFGSANPYETGPYTEKAIVLKIKNLPCYPCEESFDCELCKQILNPADVLNAIKGKDVKNFEKLIAHLDEYGVYYGEKDLWLEFWRKFFNPDYKCGKFKLQGGFKILKEVLINCEGKFLEAMKALTSHPDIRIICEYLIRVPSALPRLLQTFKEIFY